MMFGMVWDGFGRVLGIFFGRVWEGVGKVRRGREFDVFQKCLGVFSRVGKAGDSMLSTKIEGKC